MNHSMMERQKPLSIGIHTLGCRLNQYESDGIIQRFTESKDYAALPVEEGPDIAIINTCTVTDQADARNRQVIQRILKKNKDCQIIVTGCYAQTDPERLQIPGVALVVGNEHKSSLFEIVTRLNHKHKENKGLRPAAANLAKREKKAEPKEPEYAARPLLNAPFAYGKVRPFGRTRAYLKIQDGCDKKCTYCKIPMARGRGVSRPAHEILDHVRYLEDLRVPEIILTGVNLGWYRDRPAQLRFVGLLEKILSGLTYARLRLSSIEPCDVAAPLAELSLHPRFCNFLHVPLQSGSARILKAMRRSYSPYSFRKRIDTVRHFSPNIFLGTDIIVGFPGETEEDFLESLQMCRETDMSGIHGFRFSVRSGTPAAALTPQIPTSTAHQRMQRLQKLREELWSDYAQSQMESIQEGVVEKTEPFGTGEALTANYLRTCFSIPPEINIQRGQFVRLCLQEKSPGPYKLSANLLTTGRDS